MSNFKWKIFSNFVAFSEYPNFTRFDIWCVRLSLCMTGILTDQADDFSYGMFSGILDRNQNFAEQYLLPCKICIRIDFYSNEFAFAVTIPHWSVMNIHDIYHIFYYVIREKILIRFEIHFSFCPLLEKSKFSLTTASTLAFMSVLFKGSLLSESLLNNIYNYIHIHS